MKTRTLVIPAVLCSVPLLGLFWHQQTHTPPSAVAPVQPAGAWQPPPASALKSAAYRPGPSKSLAHTAKPLQGAAAKELKQRKQYDSLMGAVNQAMYGFKPSTVGKTGAKVGKAVGKASFVARNATQNFAAHFDARGVQVKTTDGEALRLQWQSVERTGEAAQSMAPAMLAVKGEELQLKRAGATEWFRNGAEGLEQGFTLHQKPEGEGSEVRLTLAASGLRAQTGQGQINLLDDEGQTALTYSKLKVWDADGKVLPSHMKAEDGRILLAMNDKGARYPVTVDPLLATSTFNGNGGAGFGGPIGTGSITVSESGGNVNFSLTTSTNFSGNVLVLYIDSKAGGISSTATLTDTSDSGRRAISGLGESGRTLATFPSGFTADYAATVEPGVFSGLFDLATPSNFGFVGSGGLSGSGTGPFTFSFSRSSLGLPADGGSFSFVGTLISTGAYRSNETFGASTTVPGSGGDAPNAGETGSVTFSAANTISSDVAQSGPHFVVNSIDDTDDGTCSTGHCSLREAIIAANDNVDGSIISFDESGVYATPQTINLTGALDALNTTITINGPAVGATIRRDSSGDYSILVVNSDQTVELSKLTLTNGQNDPDGGGGLYNEGTVTLTDCTISGNSSTYAGGGLLNFSTMTLIGCTVSGNTANTIDGFSSGGIDSSGSGTLTLTNCTFSGNTVSDNGEGSVGGALWLSSAATISNCTFSGNSASGSGSDCTGGIRVRAGSTNIGNSIVAGNTGTGGATPDVSGAFTSNGYNLIGAATGGTGFTGTADQTGTTGTPLDAKLGALANNGGLTQTMALQSGSPAIDQGKALGGVTTDQRGEMRVTDDPAIANASGGDGSDIGAYEADPIQSGSALVANNTSDTNDGFCTVLDCSLREAVNAANGAGDANTITFDTTVFATKQTITLGGAELYVNTAITITGPAAGVTVDANQQSRVIMVDRGGNLNLSAMNLINGRIIGFIGGGLFNQGGSVALTNCTLSGNYASNYGGAIYTYSPNAPSSLSLTNCTISGNSAGSQGGAIVNASNGNFAATLSSTNCTISDNTAPFYGGVLNLQAEQNGGPTTVTLDNTILKNSNGNLVNAGGAITSQGHNIASDDQSQFLNQPTDKNNTDPLLDPAGLQDNGGPTKTVALQSNSPAINTGDTLLTTDQRGMARPQGSADDIGAFEARLLTVGPASVTEGNTGTTTLTFTVMLSSPSTQTVTADYSTANGSTFPATAGTDYVATSGTLTFAPGDTVKTVDVTVNSDTTDEFNERIALQLSNLTNAVFFGAADGVIVDDDAAPSIVINDVQVTESNGGTVQAVFTLTLSQASEKPVTVIANTNSLGGSPVATPGTDYNAVTNATVTFAPGQTTRPLNVSILGDVSDENDEKFGVRLTSAVNASIADSSAVGTILDNDNPPVISGTVVNVTEGNSGDTATMTFTLKLSASSGKNVSVMYKTANSATLPATPGSDYVAVPQTTLTFLAGETTKTVDVTINGDLLDEPNERVALQLTNPVNATVGAVAEGVIVDDDATPSLSIADASTTEGNSGTKLLTFTITLSAASGQTVTVNAASSGGGSPAATAGSDYVALASTPISFAPGQTNKQISVTINGDTTVEQNEKLGVILSGAVGATIADNSGIGTITNDDAAGVVAPQAPSGGEDEK